MVESADEIMISGPCIKSLEKFSKLGMQTTTDNVDCATNCDVLMLCVKPNVFREAVADQLRDVIPESTTAVSVMSGLSIQSLTEVRNVCVVSTIRCLTLPPQALFDKAPQAPVARVMPNTPCLIQSGAIGMCTEPTVDPAIVKHVQKVFESIGEVHVVPESSMNGKLTF